jgi:hypothetical protein
MIARDVSGSNLAHAESGMRAILSRACGGLLALGNVRMYNVWDFLQRAHAWAILRAGLLTAVRCRLRYPLPMPPRLKPISLYPLSPLDALAAMLRVPPPPKTAKPASAKRRALKQRAKKKR